jgi:hypothetical protein
VVLSRPRMRSAGMFLLLFLGGSTGTRAVRVPRSQNGRDASGSCPARTKGEGRERFVSRTHRRGGTRAVRVPRAQKPIKGSRHLRSKNGTHPVHFFSFLGGSTGRERFVSRAHKRRQNPIKSKKMHGCAQFLLLKWQCGTRAVRVQRAQKARQNPIKGSRPSAVTLKAKTRQKSRTPCIFFPVRVPRAQKGRQNPMKGKKCAGCVPFLLLQYGDASGSCPARTKSNKRGKCTGCAIFVHFLLLLLLRCSTGPARKNGTKIANPRAFFPCFMGFCRSLMAERTVTLRWHRRNMNGSCYPHPFLYRISFLENVREIFILERYAHIL